MKARSAQQLATQLDMFELLAPPRDFLTELAAAARRHIARLREEDPNHYLVQMCDQADREREALEASRARGVELRAEVAAMLAPDAFREFDRRAPRDARPHRGIGMFTRGFRAENDVYWSGLLEREQRRPGAFAEDVDRWRGFAEWIEVLRARILGLAGADVLAMFDAEDKPHELPENRLGHWREAWSDTTPIRIVAEFNPVWIYHGWHLYALEEPTRRPKDGEYEWLRSEGGTQPVRDFCEFLGHRRMPRISERLGHHAFVEEFARRFSHGLPARRGRWHRYHLPDCFRTAREEPEGTCACGATAWYESRFPGWEPLEPLPGWDWDEPPAAEPPTEPAKDEQEAPAEEDEPEEQPAPRRRRRAACR